MDPTLARLSSHLRTHARRYYPEIGDAEPSVVCLGLRDGPLSRIYRLRLRTTRLERGVVVKLPPLRPAAGDAGKARPRVAPLQDPATKHRHEHDALVAVEQHLKAVGDPRLGAVRTLDFLPEEQAVWMEEVPGRPLSARIRRAHRLRLARGLPALARLFESVGAWLRAYHSLPPLAHTLAINASRGEFVARVRSLAEFLARAHPRGQLPARAAEGVEALAVSRLPAELPLGTQHGDLAPRNVIVGPDERITVLDTRAAWRAPIYEDIAYFLVAARTPRAQAASLGLAFGRGTLRRLEGAFLRGYFADEPAPWERIRLFELQALLDKWAARTDDRPPTRGVGRLGAAYRHWSVDRLLYRSLERALRRLEDAEASA